MSGRVHDFEVRPAGSGDVDGALAALGDGYGRTFTREWFEWKHLENPWGPSRCWVAEDEGGLLGVVFGMPWRLALDGASVACSRLVDGATTTRAQRRGVFRTVVAAELAAAQADAPGLVIATATPEAQAAHVKNGATALAPIGSYYRPVRWAPAGLVDSAAVLDTWTSTGAGRLGTVWRGDAMRWRVDPRSGLEYRVSALAACDQPHGVVHRTVGSAARTLVVAATWGSQADVARLLRALAWREKAVAVLAPAGPGTSSARPHAGLARGESLLCVWDHGSSAGASSLAASSWSLQGLDLEGVI